MASSGSVVLLLQQAARLRHLLALAKKLMEVFECLLRQTADQPITRQQLGAFRADLKRLNVAVGARQ